MTSRCSAPLITVVIPAFNAERFLSEAIESVLCQSYDHLELIVVDDGSTDGTAAVAGRYGSALRLVRQSNSGVSRARNHGITLAIGDFVAFLDADDVWMPTKLGAQIAYLQHLPDVGYVYSGYRVADEELRPIGETVYAPPHTALRNTLLLEAPGIWVSSTCLFRRALLSEIGGFDERLSTSADTDLALRAAQRSAVRGVPEALALYRQHGNQMHHDPDAMAHDMALVYEGLFHPAGRFPRDLQRRARANLHATLGLAFARQRRAVSATRHLLSSLRFDPRVIIRLITHRIAAGFRRAAERRH